MKAAIILYWVMKVRSTMFIEGEYTFICGCNKITGLYDLIYNVAGLKQ